MLKTRLSIALFVSTTVAVHAATVDELALESCINGDVSALGTYTQQVDEDIARAIEQSSAHDELALEPCINGDVSPLGTSPGRVLQEVYAAVGADE